MSKFVVCIHYGLSMLIKKLVVSILALWALCVVPALSQNDITSVVQRKPINYPSRVALKTNLLYDAVLIPNVGVEVNCYNNFTASVDLLCAGWNFPSKHIYWDLYGVQIGAKKYFGKISRERAFSGHHIGVYVQALAYDLQAGHIGQQTPGINFGPGVDYGYSFPIASGLNLDLELGFGYLSGRYYEYDVHDEHNTWRGTVRRAWWGPTKAAISLVWLIKKPHKVPGIKKNRRK